MSNSKKIIILDRDGVINEDSDHFIKSPEEWQAIPGSLNAIARLTQAGYRIAVITNQSGIARGLFDLERLTQIHQKMLRLITDAGGAIERILFCPHGPDDKCHCRKPKGGMFIELAASLQADLTGVPAIGDSLRDLQAAQSVNARPILVRSGKGERTLKKGEGVADIELYDDLASAVDALLAEER